MTIAMKMLYMHTLNRIFFYSLLGNPTPLH